MSDNKQRQGITTPLVILPKKATRTVGYPASEPVPSSASLIKRKEGRVTKMNSKKYKVTPTVYPPGQSGIPENDEVLAESVRKEADNFLNPASVAPFRGKEVDDLYRENS